MSAERNRPRGGLPPADLGTAFDVAGERRGRLASILPSSDPSTPERTTKPATERSPGPATVPPVPPVPDPVVDVEHDQAADDASGEDVQPVAGPRRTTKPVILYMPTQLRARLRRAAVGSTQLDVILDAVERTEKAGDLGRLVLEHQQPDTSGLFERDTPRGSESQVQVNVRARRQHIAVLDQLASRYGTNRSELVRVALDHMLPGGPRRHR
ncbi:hypothetical protein ACFV9C_44310 [Kribbella sp. NPDC059898]|uniref:hypothetical protein n=1 Tax=Kribbella sp. NPDC059898 TaxID=3346995 RepID=UPI003654C4A5